MEAWCSTLSLVYTWFDLLSAARKAAAQHDYSRVITEFQSDAIVLASLQFYTVTHCPRWKPQMLEACSPLSWYILTFRMYRADSTGSPDDVFIAVMGMTGAGKSTFIEHCTKPTERLSGHELSSCRHIRGREARPIVDW